MNKFMVNNCINCVCFTDESTCSNKDYATITTPLDEKECFIISRSAIAERYSLVSTQLKDLEDFVLDGLKHLDNGITWDISPKSMFHKLLKTIKARR